MINTYKIIATARKRGTIFNPHQVTLEIMASTPEQALKGFYGAYEEVSELRIRKLYSAAELQEMADLNQWEH